jgi:hypothetical protein
MGDDCVLGIDDLHELVDHPIGIDRPLGGRELGLPGFQPALPQAGNLLGCLPASRRASEPILDGFEELREHKLGVPEDRHIGRIGLVDIARVVGCVNDLLARRDRGAGDAMRGEAAADAEHDVGLIEEMATVARIDDAAGAERKRVILREDALAVDRGHHRSLEQVGESEQLGAGLGVKHALAGIEER